MKKVSPNAKVLPMKFWFDFQIQERWMTILSLTPTVRWLIGEPKKKNFFVQIIGKNEFNFNKTLSISWFLKEFFKKKHNEISGKESSGSLPNEKIGLDITF